MDSQIGSDIAKLLGTLGKSTGSGAQSAPNTGSGTAFKRALAASEEAQAGVATGKQLPVASTPHHGAKVAASVTEAPVASAPVAEQARSSTALPGFDLLVVGDPVEPSAIFKFAQTSGLSSAALAELFPTGANDAANPATPESALAHAVARAIADWVSSNQGAQRFVGANEAALAGTDPSLNAASMGEALNTAVAALLADGKESSEASLSELANVVAAEIQPVVDQWKALSGSGALAQVALVQQLRAAIQPVAAQWMNEHPAIAASAGVSEEVLVARLAETAVPVMTNGQLTQAQNALNSPLAVAELESAVSRWLDQNASSFDRGSVSQQWLRDLSGSIMPEMAKWMTESAESRGNVTQLAANIAPQIAQALQALSAQTGATTPELSRLIAETVPSAVRDAPTPAAMTVVQSTALMSTTLPELAAVRANALSQPEPISVAITGGDWAGDRAASKPLASALAQVVAPVASPTLPEATVVSQAMSQATLDRFALRSAGMRHDSVSSSIKTDSVPSADGVKVANVETVTALRDMVTARTLELARLGAQIEKPVTSSPTAQTPIAGLVPSDGSDSSAARLAGQGELSFRQNLAGLDRAGLSDAARSNQFSLSQNPAGREMAGRALSEALGQRLAANIAAGHYRLTFNVNPKELGAIDVVMEMRDGRLDAQINSSNAVTRELLGDSLPRLRDALQQSGINLAQLQVGSDSQQGNAQGRNGGAENAERQAADERLLADTAADVVSEDIELGLDLDSVDFWA
ncbi:MAG: flagellar hook-length control protein FliK [Luminiphilus sp.]